MSKIENKEIVGILQENLEKASSVTITDYLGLSAEAINELRGTLKVNDAEMIVAKNTLVKVALKEKGLDVESAEEDLKGPTAIIFSFSDPIAPIKALFEFAKKAELPRVKSAYIDGKYTNAAQVEVLKDLPSRDELLARVVGGLKAPLSGFANVLGGVQRKFVYAVDAIAKSKKD